MIKQQVYCPNCNLHASECVCQDTEINHLTFSYLENGEWIEVLRGMALEARQEGLKQFHQAFEEYTKTDSATSLYRWAMEALQAASLYFWVIPSSSSGKYHPPFSQGYKGLVRHTLAVMYMTRELAGTFELDPTSRAIATIAAAIHDTAKYGLEYNPRYFGVHECLVRVKLGNKGANLLKDLPNPIVEQILGAVETHNGNLKQGSWTAFRRPPEGNIAQVVHLADYVVSRKKFEFTV